MDGVWAIYFAAARNGQAEADQFDHRTYVLVNPNPNPMEGNFRGSALSDPNRHCYLRTIRYDSSGRPIFQESRADASEKE